MTEDQSVRVADSKVSCDDDNAGMLTNKTVANRLISIQTVLSQFIKFQINDGCG